MSIPELNRAARIYHKRTMLCILVPSAICFLCILAYTPFQHRFEAFLSTRFDSFTVDILTTLPMGLPSIITVLCVVWLSGRIERQSGVPCPYCARNLLNHQGIVIASRNCPNCGKRVIEDEK